MGTRLLILFLLCFCLPAPGVSQVDVLPGSTGYRIFTRLLEDFEKKPVWNVSVNGQGKGRERGLTGSTGMRRGCPDNLISYDILKKLPEAAQTQQWVLGVKIEVNEPGIYTVTIAPSVPLPIDGFVKSFSCWVYGRNVPDALVGLFADKDGDPLYSLEFGHLNYMGWKKLTVAVPGNLQQTAGPVSFSGFRLDLSPMDLQAGILYCYFDFITVTAGELPCE